MYKTIILLISLFVNINICYASTKSFMEKALNSWIGYEINDVIETWGYPIEEKNIAGRKLYIWQTSKSIYVPQNASSNVTSYGYGYAHVNTNTYGGYTVNAYCNKTLEVDKNNKIIRWEWQGNDCPGTYIRGKKIVNPENDIWAVKKQEKKKEKELKKQTKLKNKQNTIIYELKNTKSTK